MPRRLRHGLQGTVFHVMNRAVRRTILFERQQDYEAFLAVVREGLARFKIKVIAYEVMPNHWHFVVVCDRVEEVSNRYVERNALRKGLVPAAEQWQWGSLYAVCQNCHPIPLSKWPILRPVNWIEIVNRPDNLAELEALRKLVERNQPIGDPDWQKAVAPFIGLSMRPVGRPKKIPDPCNT